MKVLPDGMRKAGGTTELESAAMAENNSRNEHIQMIYLGMRLFINGLLAAPLYISLPNSAVPRSNWWHKFAGQTSDIVKSLLHEWYGVKRKMSPGNVAAAIKRLVGA
jgi:hypothetical protein